MDDFSEKELILMEALTNGIVESNELGCTKKALVLEKTVISLNIS